MPQRILCWKKLVHWLSHWCLFMSLNHIFRANWLKVHLKLAPVNRNTRQLLVAQSRLIGQTALCYLLGAVWPVKRYSVRFSAVFVSPDQSTNNQWGRLLWDFVSDQSVPDPLQIFHCNSTDSSRPDFEHYNKPIIATNCSSKALNFDCNTSLQTSKQVNVIS